MAMDNEVKRLVEKAFRLGYDYEGKYGGCGQCTIAALQDTLGLRDNAVFKAATGFAGATGLLCDTGCGAFSGGAMFIGCVIGRERDNFEDPAGIRLKTHSLVRKLHDRFITEYGSVICRDLHSKIFGRFFYMLDPEEYKKFEAAGAHTTKCTSVCGNTCQWVIEILNEKNLLPGPGKQ